MKKIWKLSYLLFANIYGMIKEEENTHLLSKNTDISTNVSNSFIEVEKISLLTKKMEELTDTQKLNNMANYVDMLGSHTYTDHCPKIANLIEEVRNSKNLIEKLEKNVKDLQQDIGILESRIYGNENKWKCQII